MRIQVLGPLRLWSSGDSEIAIASARLQKILAALVLAPDTVVTVSRLVDVVWPADPPTTARQQIQTCVSALRRKLRQADGEADIVAHPAGYKICLPVDALDSSLFLSHLRRAQTALAEGDERVGGGHLRDGLSLWRGRALEDIGSDALLPAQVHLEELRIGAIVAYIEVAQRFESLDPGHVADLKSWVRTFPHHEQLTVATATALYHCGRITDALEVIRQHKRRLAEDLGLDVTGAILRLEQTILRSGAAKTIAVQGIDG